MEAIRKAKGLKLTRQAVINARINYQSLALAMDQTDSVEEDALVPEKFLELPDELDVCIAERNFEKAVALLQEGAISRTVSQLWRMIAPSITIRTMLRH